MAEQRPPAVPARQRDLNATARVILGMLSLGMRTGYDIKQFVDSSTRFFWAASYGQIYPELRRLEQQGLVRSHPEPTGGRARTVFELTEDGEAALRGWLESADEPLFELRCESMLKLFFSDAADPAYRLANLRAFRALHERKLAQLRAIKEPASAGHYEGPSMSRQFGIAFTEWILGWTRELERRLTAEER
jgi:DNA-binding PadR family transcriptional regulator